MQHPAIVTARMAFSYTCPHCNKEGFVKGIPHEFSVEEARELSEDVGEVMRTGDWLTHPTHITCSNCEADLTMVNEGEVIEAE